MSQPIRLTNLVLAYLINSRFSRSLNSDQMIGMPPQSSGFWSLPAHSLVCKIGVIFGIFISTTNTYRIITICMAYWVYYIILFRINVGGGISRMVAGTTRIIQLKIRHIQSVVTTPKGTFSLSPFFLSMVGLCRLTAAVDYDQNWT
jgi:hypothetical protein